MKWLRLRFDELLFPDHPYGRPEEGFIEKQLIVLTRTT